MRDLIETGSKFEKNIEILERSDLDTLYVNLNGYVTFLQANDPAFMSWKKKLLQRQNNDSTTREMLSCSHHKEKPNDLEYYNDQSCGICFLGSTMHSIVERWENRNSIQSDEKTNITLTKSACSHTTCAKWKANLRSMMSQLLCTSSCPSHEDKKGGKKGKNAKKKKRRKVKDDLQIYHVVPSCDIPEFPCAGVTTKIVCCMGCKKVLLLCPQCQSKGSCSPIVGPTYLCCENFLDSLLTGGCSALLGTENSWAQDSLRHESVAKRWIQIISNVLSSSNQTNVNPSPSTENLNPSANDNNGTGVNIPKPNSQNPPQGNWQPALPIQWGVVSEDQFGSARFKKAQSFSARRKAAKANSAKMKAKAGKTATVTKKSDNGPMNKGPICISEEMRAVYNKLREDKDNQELLSQAKMVTEGLDPSKTEAAIKQVRKWLHCRE
eukprot:TRINITY_DN103698_c0_g1_i1.p1 TRINITY_DN103698_c0_g1~~TRINITY_DN103698_c0_g1_i1.p1  ORF type:complete len:437 (-),score=144.11 TRINITY_DN103698_c0_g1_i1:65-1375(-)